MEEHTRALEIVCKHYRQEYMSEDISKHRKALRRAYQRNSRLRAEKDAQHIELMMLKQRYSGMRHELFLTRRCLLQFID